MERRGSAARDRDRLSGAGGAAAWCRAAVAQRGGRPRGRGSTGSRVTPPARPGRRACPSDAPCAAPPSTMSRRPRPPSCASCGASRSRRFRAPARRARRAGRRRRCPPAAARELGRKRRRAAELRSPDAAPPAASRRPRPTRTGCARSSCPSFPVRWDAQVLRYLDYFKNDPKGRAVMSSWLRRAGRYRELFDKALARHGLPRDLFYLAMIESGFETGARSRVGAGGVWQFMPGAARAYGLEVSYWIDARRDPERAAEAAGALPQGSRTSASDPWPLAFAAYNAGYGAVLRSITSYNTNDYWELVKHESGLPWESSVYVPKILAAAIVGRNLAAFGFADVTPDPPFAYDEVEVPAGTTLATVARAAGSEDRGGRVAEPAAGARPDAARSGADAGARPAGHAPRSTRPASTRRAPADSKLETVVLRFGETLDERGPRCAAPAARELRRLNGVKDSGRAARRNGDRRPACRQRGARPARPTTKDDDAASRRRPTPTTPCWSRSPIAPSATKGASGCSTGRATATAWTRSPTRSASAARTSASGTTSIPARSCTRRWCCRSSCARTSIRRACVLLDPAKVRVVTLGSEEFLELETARRGKKRLYVHRQGRRHAGQDRPPLRADAGRSRAHQPVFVQHGAARGRSRRRLLADRRAAARDDDGDDARQEAPRARRPTGAAKRAPRRRPRRRSRRPPSPRSTRRPDKQAATSPDKKRRESPEGRRQDRRPRRSSEAARGARRARASSRTRPASGSTTRSRPAVPGLSVAAAQTPAGRRRRRASTAGRPRKGAAPAARPDDRDRRRGAGGRRGTARARRCVPIREPGRSRCCTRTTRWWRSPSRPGMPSHPLAPGQLGTAANAIVRALPRMRGRVARSARGGPGPPPRRGHQRRADRGAQRARLAAAARRARRPETARRPTSPRSWARPPDAGVETAPIGRVGRRGARVRVGGGPPAAQPARTAWTGRRAARRRPRSCARACTPGRPHQVRAHLAAAGHPIVGDTNYGGAPNKRPHPQPTRARSFAPARGVGALPPSGFR